ncbi:MAG: insulinase family protein [Planctomycetes bacterium]|nr:insulinase family protein [Planctomycetota bacterium]
MRKKLYFLGSLLLVSVLLVIQCSASKPAVAQSETPDPDQRIGNPDKIKFPPIKIVIPKPGRVELDNGIVLYTLENHELPLTEITVRIKTGSLCEPQDKLGLASLTAVMMRNGGIGKLSPMQVDEKLETMCATLNASSEYEEINFTLTMLKDDLDEGLKLLSDLLTAPQFDEERLKFEKAQLAESFRRENDKSDDIGYRKIIKIIYPEHPYGNVPAGTAETVESISRGDIVGFYNRYVKPNNIFVAVGGDFNASEILKMVHDKLGKWEKQAIDLPKLPLLELKYQKSINLVPKEVNQTSIIIGHLGIKRTSPDFFPLIVMNAILGGASSSRLEHSVREEKGLAYGIWSYFIMRRDLGVFLIQTDTKNESVSEVTGIILDEVEKMRNEPVKDEELIQTKDSILNGFVFRFDKTSRILDQYIYIEYMGISKDYLETYRDNIMKVTKEDIQRVARQYLHPEDFTFMYVGNRADIEKQIQEFGAVNIINLEEKK